MKTIKYVLEDYRIGRCQFCEKDTKPIIRHCTEVHDKDIGVVSDNEIEACISCSNKKFKGWRRLR